MWQNKSDIAEELQLPPQTECVHWVSFRSVEEYYYSRQLETCRVRMTSWMWPEDRALSGLSHSDMTKLLTPLHSLRQACCTPGIVKSGYLPQDLGRNMVVTMDILLSKLTQQAKMEARESLRQIVSTLNGLAGLYSLNATSLCEQYDAMCCYQEAIDMWETYREFGVDCDKLQRIHTLEHLVKMMSQAEWSTMPSKEEFVALHPEYRSPDDRDSHVVRCEDWWSNFFSEDSEMEDDEEEEVSGSDVFSEDSEMEDDEEEEVSGSDGESRRGQLLEGGSGERSDGEQSSSQERDVGMLERREGMGEGEVGMVWETAVPVELGGGSEGTSIAAELAGASRGNDQEEAVSDRRDSVAGQTRLAEVVNRGLSVSTPGPPTSDVTPAADEGGVTQESLGAEQGGVAPEQDGAAPELEQVGVAQDLPAEEHGGVAQESATAEQGGMTQGMLGVEQGGIGQELVAEEQGSVAQKMTSMEQGGVDQEITSTQQERMDQQTSVAALNGAATSEPEGGTEATTSDVEGVAQVEGDSSAEKPGVKSKEQKLVLKDDLLLVEAKRLREEYINKDKENVQVAMTVVQSSRQNTQEASEKLSEEDKPTHMATSTETREAGQLTPWWASVLLWFKSTQTEEGAFEYLQGFVPCVYFNHSRLEGLTLDITLKITDLERKRATFWESLEEIFDSVDSKELLEDAVMCHLDRDFRGIYDDCLLCKTKEYMCSYEQSLFSSYSEVVSQSSRLPSLVEQCLKGILSAARRKSAGTPECLVSAGQSYMNYLEALRKEYPLMQQLWMVMEDLVGRRYRLLQASAKLYLSHGISRRQHFLNHIGDDFESSCIMGGPDLQQDEVPLRMMQWKYEKKAYLVNLKKQIGRIVYLNNLEAQHRRPEHDSCPICTVEMGNEVGMFPCGHTFCKTCTDEILYRQGRVWYRPRLSCPMCRAVCSSHKVRYVLLGCKHEGGLEGEEAEKPVANLDHSSKILAVVKTLLTIRRKEPAAKTLVFSWWSEVLTPISHCLEENHVNHLLLTQPKFQAHLTTFKTDPSVNVLLLPFRLGSKGLNIVEATHVLLVEPQLNLATEVQAIRRVHYIGHTKATTVHRFVVRGTVEEHIYEWTKKERQEHSTGETLLECDPKMTCADIKRLLMGDGGVGDMVGEEEEEEEESTDSGSEDPLVVLARENPMATSVRENSTTTSVGENSATSSVKENSIATSVRNSTARSVSENATAMLVEEVENPM